MKSHRETILPPSAPKSSSAAAKGQVEATNTLGEDTCTQIKKKKASHILFNVLTIAAFISFLCLDVERRPSGQNEAESHEKLAQRIEKDVVGVTPVITLGFVHCLITLLHAKTPGFVSLSKPSTAPWMT